MTPPLYVYKLTVDDGGAPCVTDDLLSLAICKPAIRSTAAHGAIIFGIGSVSEPLCNRLVYIAVVTDKETGGQYYEKPKFAAREDCIYERGPRGLFRRKSTARHHAHPANLPHDLGHPPAYDRANVLLSADFRYFGDAGTDDYKARFPELKALAEGLRQGHRINHPDDLRCELLQLKAEVWKKFPQQMRLGSPTQPLRAITGADSDDCCYEICSPNSRCLPDDECDPGC